MLLNVSDSVIFWHALQLFRFQPDASVIEVRVGSKLYNIIAFLMDFNDCTTKLRCGCSKFF